MAEERLELSDEIGGNRTRSSEILEEIVQERGGVILGERLRPERRTKERDITKEIKKRRAGGGGGRRRFREEASKGEERVEVGAREALRGGGQEGSGCDPGELVGEEVGSWATSIAELVRASILSLWGEEEKSKGDLGVETETRREPEVELHF
ncbi:uncharacterized protein A4U43_C03F16170 [Asparagus officinalis]|uniref:Uncharacterized protein n=1 Tax=Asparagus officinalis TaxID=4686 RepID=A0A5P1FAI2_ASPOF|nr:uncharacterized protein A4U43_C03F16170 [Asparagus officinalis]